MLNGIRLIRMLAALPLALAGWTVAAPAAQDLAAIRASAEALLLEQASAHHSGRVEVRIGRLDPRLKLAPCRQPLEARLPDGARLIGRSSVQVSCPDLPGWSLYVTGQIDVFQKMLVTRRAIARGETLSRDDLVLAERNLARLQGGGFDDPAEILGKVAVRALPAGTPLRPALVRGRKLISRGDRVTLVADQGGIQVRMQGEAVSDGRAGERVRVRALSSRRIVEGRVAGAGVVKVTL
ncbi:flagellar basal body P-ring formation chaperone FlgA [Thiohalobacter sp.]|uniref:flagellar basal body P-ring formation chaperone FlgA n=1 Tax=Thiohalobacter sp. TaxID=2025948 RepID=UPI0026201BDC|nr:flagellar basal body P-ring formation chaperone FlgA [Thiohalobacter sp.]